MLFTEFLDILPNKVTKKWAKDNLSLESYIPVVDKYAEAKVISRVILDMASSVNYEDALETNYLYMKYDIFVSLTLFARYTNLVIEDIDKNSANYDKIFSSGVYDIIVEACKEDFERFRMIIDRIVGIADLSIYREIGRVLTSDAYFERLEKTKKILNGISLKKYEALERIQKFNDPITSAVVEQLKTNALDDAISKQKAAIQDGTNKRS